VCNGGFSHWEEGDNNFSKITDVSPNSELSVVIAKLGINIFYRNTSEKLVKIENVNGEWKNTLSPFTLTPGTFSAYSSKDIPSLLRVFAPSNVIYWLDLSDVPRPASLNWTPASLNLTPVLPDGTAKLGYRTCSPNFCILFSVLGIAIFKEYFPLKVL
jgi:hypothetical protein